MRKLDPELAIWLDDYNQLWNEIERSGFIYTVKNAREGLSKLTHKLVTNTCDVESIIDDCIMTATHAVPVRIYQPDVANLLPVLVFLHGGGHMCGSIEDYDKICRQLAVTSRHIVVAVDYRLAPEFPYPCGIEDAEVVVMNIHSLLEALSISYQQQFSIAGDSGGGAMAATLAHRLQQCSGINIHKQVLIYPSLDYGMQHASLDLNGRGYLLHKDKIEWFFSQYLQNGEDVQKVSPLSMPYSAKLPSTLMITAEFCPLRDEGYQYVENLNRVGVANQHLHFDDMIHAFINMQDIVPKQCDSLYQHIARFLND
jgi:acetyl esterase